MLRSGPISFEPAEDRHLCLFPGGTEYFERGWGTPASLFFVRLAPSLDAQPKPPRGYGFPVVPVADVLTIAERDKSVGSRLWLGL